MGRMGKGRSRLEDHAGRFRALHGAGEPLGYIARTLGVSETTAYRWMVRLGLPSNYGRGGVSVRGRKAIGKRLKRNLRDNGFKSSGQWRQLAYRIRYARMGWPQADSMAQARALDGLARADGATTGAELGRLTGMAWSTERDTRLRMALRKLARRRLVVRTRRSRKGVGGSLPSLYQLADGVRRHTPSREKGDGPLPDMLKKLLHDQGDSDDDDLP